MGEWREIATAPKDQQILLWEPMYGALLGGWNSESWSMKSSGNYWMDIPPSVKITHWAPLPSPPNRESDSAGVSSPAS